LTSALAPEVSSYLASLPSAAVQGLLPAFENLPTPDEVKSKLNVSDEELQNAPLKVLNIPGYANWTSSGWSLRVHGSAYKQPALNDTELDDAADIFLPGLNTSNLTTSEREESRNVTAQLLVVPWPGMALNFSLVQPNGGDNCGACSPGIVALKTVTTDVGEFDEMVPLGKLEGVADGNGTGPGFVTKLDLLSSVDPMTGNASSYFVPEQGITIVSDIDDILRVTKIYQPEQGLQNSFAKNYTPWMNMPQIYQNWSTIGGVHFHYLTTLPEQVTRAYEAFTFSEYPLGSFDDRPLNFTTLDQTFAIRKVRLLQVLESFPRRKFVLVADTSNADVMRDYPAMKKQFPDQVACILLRNTSATDPDDKFPYDTSGFEGIDNSTYMFFRTPDDLTGIDLLNGCRNNTFQQNVTFGYQGLPSFSKTSGGVSTAHLPRKVLNLVAVLGAVGVLTVLI